MKITRASCRRRACTVVPREEHFGDLIASRNNHRYAVVVQDLATQWIQSYPCKSKSSLETQRNLMKSFTLTIPWNLASLARNYPGIIVRQHHVDQKQRGSSAVLLQSSLGNEWWADSMECHRYLRNIQDLLSDGKTPYERRFGMPFDGPVIPFGAMVEYHLTSIKDQSRLHQFVPKVLPGIFLGYALHAGGIWKGDVEELDASELHVRRLNAKEVLTA